MPYDPATIDVDQLGEMYGRLGLAVYLAQCFEISLGNFFLLHFRLTDPTLTLSELAAMLAVLEQRKTLGV